MTAAASPGPSSEGSRDDTGDAVLETEPLTDPGVGQQPPRERVATAEREDGLPDSLGRNVSINYAAVVVASLAAIITTPLLLRFLGQDAFGLWVLAGSVVGYIEIVDLGFGVAATKMMAEDAGRRPERVVRTLNSNFFALAALAPLALLVGAIVAWRAPTLFDVPPGLETEAVAVFAILVVSIAASVPLDVIGGSLAGHQRYDLLSLSNLTLTLVSTISAVVVAAFGGGIVGVALATATTTIAVHYLRWRMLHRLVPGLRLSPTLVDRATLRLAGGMSGWFTLRKVSDIVINRVDLLVVGLLLGVREVAVYAIGLKLAQLGRRAMLPLSQVFFPHASALSADDDVRRLGLLLLDGTRVSMLIATPIMLVLAVIADSLILAWVGSGFGAAATVLLLLAIARGLTAVTDTAWWLLAGAGWIKPTAIVAVVEAAVNIALSVALARSLGVAGVALGTLAGVALVGLPASIALSSRLTGVPLGRFLRSALLPHLLPTLVLAAALAALRPVLPGAVVPAVAVSVVAFVAYVGLYLSTTAAPAERERAASFAARMRARTRR